MTGSGSDYEKAVKMIGADKLIYYYPIALHYGSAAECDIQLEGCIDYINGDVAAFGFHGNRIGSDDSGRDICMRCFNKMIANGYEPKFPIEQESKARSLIFDTPNHIHVINFGSPVIKAQMCGCLRCKKSINGPVLQSSRGTLCFYCVDVLTTHLLPLQELSSF